MAVVLLLNLEWDKIVHIILNVLFFVFSIALRLHDHINFFINVRILFQPEFRNEYFIILLK